jgi:hypothetical protein
MSEDLTTIGPDAPLEEAASLLVVKKIGCLPVVADGRLVGIVTETDLLAVLVELLGLLTHSTRLDVGVAGGPDAYERIVEIIRAHDGRIISVGAGPRNSAWSAVRHRHRLRWPARGLSMPGGRDRPGAFSSFLTRPERSPRRRWPPDGVILDLDAVPRPKAQARVGGGGAPRVASAPGRICASTPRRRGAGRISRRGSGGAGCLAPAQALRCGRSGRLDAEVSASSSRADVRRAHPLPPLVETVAASRSGAWPAPSAAAALFTGRGPGARDARPPGARPADRALHDERVVLVARHGLDAMTRRAGWSPDRLEAHTRIGADLGYDGKALIHPSQIAVANQCFTPSPEAVAEARRVLAAYEAAEEKGRGALALEGQFVDAVHVLIARDTLSRARLAGVLT